jgi:hypothetical protein
MGFIEGRVRVVIILSNVVPASRVHVGDTREGEV